MLALQEKKGRTTARTAGPMKPARKRGRPKKIECSPCSIKKNREPKEFGSAMGKRVIARRTELGMNQAELVRRSGLSQKVISDLETGRTEDPKGLVRIARVLDTYAEWIYDGNGPAQRGNVAEQVWEKHVAMEGFKLLLRNYVSKLDKIPDDDVLEPVIESFIDTLQFVEDKTPEEKRQAREILRRQLDAHTKR